MTKQEFLIQLQRALNGRIGSFKAAPVVEYYQEYIEIEMRKGRPVEEVMEELGSPLLIARSIEEASGSIKQRKNQGTALLEKVFGKIRAWFENL